MNAQQQLFMGKLQEMERQYRKTTDRIGVCGQGDPAKVRQELQKAREEYRRSGLQLRQRIEESRSPAVAELAKAQLESNRKMERLLENGQLTRFLHSEENSGLEDRVEVAALYAEYAVDFAVQAMQYALIAALSAIDLQENTEEETEVF